jgi:hypothetical protein
MSREERVISETQWEGMATFPKDGTITDILFEGGAIATKIHWGYPPIGSTMTYVGDTNVLSPWLLENRRFVGWRPHKKEDA